MHFSFRFNKINGKKRKKPATVSCPILQRVCNFAARLQILHEIYRKIREWLWNYIKPKDTVLLCSPHFSKFRMFFSQWNALHSFWLANDTFRKELHLYEDNKNVFSSKILAYNWAAFFFSMWKHHKETTAFKIQ